MRQETAQRKWTWWGINTIVLIYAFIPVVWIVSMSLKDAGTLNDGRFLPVSPTTDSYSQIFDNSDFTRALVNSIGICLIATFVALVFGTMAAYAIARLDFPGKRTIVAVSLLISMFPQIALVTPLFKILTTIGLFDTWMGLIIPYVTFALPLAIYTLSAFFREIPGAGEGGEDGRRNALPGLPPGHHATRDAGRVHHRDPRLHRLLERLPLRHLADVHVRVANRSRGHVVLHRCRRPSRSPSGPSPQRPWSSPSPSSSSCCSSSGASWPASPPALSRAKRPNPVQA